MQGKSEQRIMRILRSQARYIGSNEDERTRERKKQLVVGGEKGSDCGK